MSIFQSCTINEYANLVDKDSIDVVLKHVKVSSDLVTPYCTIKPKQSTLQDFTFKEVIWFKNMIQAQELDEIVKMIYCIEDTSDCCVYSYTGTLKWIDEELQKIIKKEERLVSKEDSEAWEAAGIDKLSVYGQYVTLFMISKDLTQEDTILAMPYYRVFDYMECSKDWNQIQTKFQKIKSEK